MKYKSIYDMSDTRLVFRRNSGWYVSFLKKNQNLIIDGEIIYYDMTSHKGGEAFYINFSSYTIIRSRIS